MTVGFDYWQVTSHYPEYFRQLADMHREAGDKVVIISEVEERTIGTVEARVRRLGFSNEVQVHEVQFDHPQESPALKVAKCRELGVSVFYDDRDDVCRSLTESGILAVRVTRQDGSIYDLSTERDAAA